MLGKSEFENMSLYTLASLYLDTFKDYFNRVVYDADLNLNARILDYIITNRKDESRFFDVVNRVYSIRINNKG